MGTAKRTEHRSKPLACELIRAVKALGADITVMKSGDNMLTKLVGATEKISATLLEQLKESRLDIIWSLTTPHRIVMLSDPKPTAAVSQVLHACLEWDWDDWWATFCDRFPGKLLAIEYLGGKGWVRCLWSVRRCLDMISASVDDLTSSEFPSAMPAELT